MTKKIEVIIIENDTQVIHRTVSTVYDDSNAYTVAINAIVEDLTSTNIINKGIKVSRPLAKDKFAEAVPDYKPPVMPSAAPTGIGIDNTHGIDFHPDLVKAGVVPKPIPKEGDIPVVKISMKEVMKGTK